MYTFGTTSRERLKTCHPDLQELMDRCIEVVDFTIICGHRSEEDQVKAVNQGLSKVDFPNSKHNSLPSMAVDVAPFPIDWDNIARFAHLVGIIRGVAAEMGINIRCGCDWDGDGDITDQKFMDWPHIELI